jgi:hypothetical protein
MHDLPSMPALLALARDVLVNELSPLLPEERKGDALLVAEAIAIAARQSEAGDEPTRAVITDLEMLYGPLTPALSPQCGEREGPADPRIKSGEEGEGQCGGAPLELWRRFAGDLRAGAFENSGPCDQAARAILWRLTIATLRQLNPNFLKANGFD